jgi:hypothetical protein
MLEDELQSEEALSDEKEEDSDDVSTEELETSSEPTLEEVEFGLHAQRMSLISTPPMFLTCLSSVHFSPATHASTPRHLAHICFAEPPSRVNVYSVYPSGHFFDIASGSTVVTLHFPSAHSAETDDCDDSSEQNSSLLEELEDEDDIGSQDHSHVIVHHCQTQEPFGQEEEDDDSDDSLLRELETDAEESKDEESEEADESIDDSTEELDESVELALDEEELPTLHPTQDATSFFTQRVASGLSSESLQTDGLFVQSMFVPLHTEPISHPMSSPASVTPLPHRLMHAKLQFA